MPTTVPFLSDGGSRNYETAIKNGFFCQLQFGQVCGETLKSIIAVERGREVNSSGGTSGKACRRIHCELQIVFWGLWPQILDSATKDHFFQIHSQILCSFYSFLNYQTDKAPFACIYWLKGVRENWENKKLETAAYLDDCVKKLY